jgi:hypothetical protein
MLQKADWGVLRSMKQILITSWRDEADAGGFRTWQA